LRPDPQAVRQNAVRSLARVILALGNANDRRIYPVVYAARTWPHATCRCCTRSVVSPASLADSPTSVN
jgi:hypothetical protein